MDYRLAQSVGDFKSYLSDYRGAIPERVIAQDTETTGLNTRRDTLVGQSVSLKPETGIYVPHAHLIGTNVPLLPIMRVLDEFIKEEELTTLYFNAKFDRNILQAATTWVASPFEDVMESVYMENPDRKAKGLKDVVLEEFGFQMEKFDDLFSDAEKKAKIKNIATKSPTRCTNYGCSDSDWTLQTWLLPKYVAIRAEQSFAFQVDTPLVDVIRKIEHNGGSELNEEYLHYQIDRLDRQAEALREQIFRMAGVRFEINSPKQLGDVLFGRMGIPSPGMTRSEKHPQHKTNEEALEKLSKNYPIIEYVITYKKIFKAKGSYFEKLLKVMQMKIPIRFQFNMYSAPTFRFSAPGGDPKKDGGLGINIQAVSNGEARDMQAVDLQLSATAGNYLEDLDEDEILVTDNAESIKDSLEGDPDYDLKTLAWVFPHEDDPEHLFCVRETCVGCPAACLAKGIDTTRRFHKGLHVIPSVRQAFRAPAGYTILSFDYDRQELVIGANMSGEPKWLRALKDGIDLHVVSAAGAFGMPPEKLFGMKKTNPGEFKRLRGIGKVLNFAIFYGANGYTTATKANIPIQEGERVYEGFKRAHPTVMSWITKCHIFSRKSKFTTTFFGRKRKLDHIYIKDATRAQMAFGDRSAVNTPIQGTAAEITRIAMVKVSSKLKKEGYKANQIRFFIQLHDDLSFIVRNDMVAEVAPKIKEAMEFNVKGWQVQLSVGCKIGRVWGNQKEVDNLALLATHVQNGELVYDEKA